MTRAEDSSYEYLSYLLRLWRRGSVWHVVLERIGSGERQSFKDFESLLEFLNKQTIESRAQKRL